MAIVAMLAAACAGAEETSSVAGKAPAATLSDAERGVAQLAIDALAGELDVEEDRIQIDTIRAVNWPDSSLGCPQPGRAYLQVVTPGHKVTLRADGRVHVVHEAKGRAFVCEQTKPYTGVDPKGELVFSGQMLDARKDLASRLGVPENEIKFSSAQERTWDDAALGCPEPGKTYPPGKVTGWVLALAHEKRVFTYHTDLQRTIPCPPIAGQ
jgi:hypothetical protein